MWVSECTEEGVLGALIPYAVQGSTVFSFRNIGFNLKNQALMVGIKYKIFS